MPIQIEVQCTCFSTPRTIQFDYAFIKRHIVVNGCGAQLFEDGAQTGTALNLANSLRINLQLINFYRCLRCHYFGVCKFSGPYGSLGNLKRCAKLTKIEDVCVTSKLTQRSLIQFGNLKTKSALYECRDKINGLFSFEIYPFIINSQDQFPYVSLLSSTFHKQNQLCLCSHLNAGLLHDYSERKRSTHGTRKLRLSERKTSIIKVAIEKKADGYFKKGEINFETRRQNTDQKPQLPF